MHMEFTVDEKAGRKLFSCEIKGAVICGYTGRNQPAVLKHIEELKKEGIQPPPSVPMYYPKPAWGLSVDGEIHVQGAQTSGELEFVLLLHDGILYVGLGSDHTDRELEKLDILKSKQVCQAVISQTLWSYEDIRDHWDQIEFRSWVTRNGERFLYQQSTVASMLTPEDLIARVRARVSGECEDLAIFSGTVPLLTDGFVYADRFEGALLDPVLGRTIHLGYDVHTLEWFTA
jgi:Protein of unknown function (DUF2848)